MVWKVVGGLAAGASLIGLGYALGEHGDSDDIAAAYDRGVTSATREFEKSQSRDETLATLIGVVLQQQRDAGASPATTEALAAAEESIFEGDFQEATVLIKSVFEVVPDLDCAEPGQVYSFQTGDLFRVCGENDYVDIEEIKHDFLRISINGYEKQLTHGERADSTGILFRCKYVFVKNDPETDSERAFIKLDC